MYFIQFLAGALALGSAIANHAAQNSAATQNAEAARRAFAQAIKDINLQELEVLDQTEGTIFQAERQARAARAMARVSAGEAGVEGISADQLEDQILRDSDEFRVGTLRHAEAQIRQLEREKISGREQTQNRINTVPRANPFATALQIGTAGLGVMRMSMNNETPLKTTTEDTNA